VIEINLMIVLYLGMLCYVVKVNAFYYVGVVIVVRLFIGNLSKIKYISFKLTISFNFMLFYVILY
jgi:hypothetical protein